MSSFFKYFMMLIETISNNGLKKRYNNRLKQKVRIINQYWTLYTMACLLVGVEMYYFNCKQWHVIFLYTIIAASSVVLILNRMHLHDAAIMTLYVFVFFTIYHGDSITRGKGGFSLFYFVGFFSIMCLMGVAGIKNIFFYCFVMLITLGSNIYYNYQIFSDSGISYSDLMKIYFVNLFITMGLFIYFSVLVLKMARQEKRIYLTYLREKIVKENLTSKSIKDKEILLVELHHRVKNNLAIITSMLNMQASKTEEGPIKLALHDTRNRVISMSLVHDMLYKSTVSSRIDFAEYCLKLGENISMSFPEYDNRVKIVFKTEETYLNLGEAIPCGMILNELLTNSYKHAFRAKQYGEITIKVFSRNKEINMSVADNGTFVNSDNESSVTVGKTIVEALAEQLSADWSYNFDNGTHFNLSFSRS